MKKYDLCEIYVPLRSQSVVLYCMLRYYVYDRHWSLEARVEITISCPLCCFGHPQGKLTEAVELLERALSIWLKTLGENHPHTMHAREFLQLLQEVCALMLRRAYRVVQAIFIVHTSCKHTSLRFSLLCSRDLSSQAVQIRWAYDNVTSSCL